MSTREFPSAPTMIRGARAASFPWSPFASAKHDVQQIDYTAYALKRRQGESVQSVECKR